MFGGRVERDRYLVPVSRQELARTTPVRQKKLRRMQLDLFLRGWGNAPFVQCHFNFFEQRKICFG
jgi:hypothetical protein